MVDSLMFYGILTVAAGFVGHLCLFPPLWGYGRIRRIAETVIFWTTMPAGIAMVVIGAALHVFRH